MPRQQVMTQALSALALLMTIVAPAVARTPPTYSDLVYAPGLRHDLDLYIPENPCGKWPVVIFIFGGGWQFGDEDDVQPYVDELLARRFAVAAINYRYSVQAIFPAQIHDVKGGIRWLRANAATYNLDPDRFAIFGESSGGHLSALVGTSADVPALEGSIGGNRGVSSGVKAVGQFCAPTDLLALFNLTHSQNIARLFGYGEWWQLQEALDNNTPGLLELIQSANPGPYATANDAVFRIVQGQLDSSVPPIQSQYMHNAIVNAGGTSTLTLLRNVGHAIPLSEYLPVFDAFKQQLIPTPRVGDLNCDGVVNTDDLVILVAAWGPCLMGNPCPDTNNDGTINTDDLINVIVNWG